MGGAYGYSEGGGGGGATIFLFFFVATAGIRSEGGGGGGASRFPFFFIGGGDVLSAVGLGAVRAPLIDSEAIAFPIVFSMLFSKAASFSISRAMARHS